MATRNNIKCTASQESTSSESSLECGDLTEIFGVELLAHSTQQSSRSTDFNGEPFPPSYPSVETIDTQSFKTVPIVRRQQTTESMDQFLDDFHLTSVAKRGRLYAERQTRRLVQKNGECNVTSVGVTKRKRKYMADMFTTLIEMRWRYHAILYFTQFLVTWCLFGSVYYAVVVLHGDVNHINNSSWSPCVAKVYDYQSALMFSVETQATIGYGTRVINPACRFAMFIVMLQTCVGTFIQVLATGLIFAKMSRPKGRAKTILFSRNAVICQRDGQYQFMFRVADMRNKSHIIATSIRALMVRNRVTAEGEVIPLCQYPLVLDNETSPVDDIFLFMVWPVTIVHKIDESSPLWDISSEQLVAEQFEIIVILEGTIESTGSSTQVRTSYVPSEIRWGQRLAPLVTFHKGNGMYSIDYSQFHNTIPVPMPDCSARSWANRRSDRFADRLRTSSASDCVIDFTAIDRTHVTPLARIISKLFRYRVNELDIENGEQPESRLETRSQSQTSVVWTVADPSNPASTLARHSSQLWQEDDDNNNGSRCSRSTRQQQHHHHHQ